MRRVHEQIARLVVAAPRIVLHLAPDDPAFRVEHRKSRPDLGREGEQVELGTKTPVVASLCFFEPWQVLRQRLVRFPCGPVDALQLLAVLVATPVGAGDALELEVPEIAGRRDVGAPAQVDELLACCGKRSPRVPSPASALRSGSTSPPSPLLSAATVSMISTLNGWSAKRLQPGRLVVLLAMERLVLPDDRAHLRVDPRQVLVGEVSAARKLEVVVEAAFDHRPDREVGARPQPGDRLRHHVRRRVPKHRRGPGRSTLRPARPPLRRGARCPRSTSTPSTIAATLRSCFCLLG